MHKNKVGMLTRGAGMAADVWTRLDRAVKAQGGTDEDLHLLAREEGQSVINTIAGLLVKAGAAARNAYPVTIDYSQSVADMVQAGKYDVVNEYITAEKFPIQGEGTVGLEVILVHFDGPIESDDAVREMDQMGLVPCKIEHLLALGAKHPDLQKEYPIICLGSSWVDPNGNRRIPCLHWWSDERALNLPWFGHGWNGRCRFAAVRK